MDKNSYDASVLKDSIQEMGFTEDTVTVCLTSKCSECKGQYMNLVLRHKFVCLHSCHKTTTATSLGMISLDFNPLPPLDDH